MAMKKIRIELARARDFPEGSRNHGYEFTAPLDEDDRIDVEDWHNMRDRCRVRRFWGDERDEIGHLVRKPGGSWAFHYDLHGDEEDDETGYRFANHEFRLGEYVSLREHDDELRTFRIVSVTDLPD
ncbi:MAG: hypothetical protein Q8P46_05515 [Hyphomicrobiales bacterium]|nr:hypothetical protein [Hyphomicrobiales bacterium]